MKLFKRKTASPAVTEIVTAQRCTDPLPALPSTIGQAEKRLYDRLRFAVPVIDAAIMKMIRLTGGFQDAAAGHDDMKDIDRADRRTVSKSRRALFTSAEIQCDRGHGRDILHHRDILKACKCAVFPEIDQTHFSPRMNNKQLGCKVRRAADGSILFPGHHGAGHDSHIHQFISEMAPVAFHFIAEIRIKAGQIQSGK